MKQSQMTTASAARRAARDRLAGVIDFRGILGTAVSELGSRIVGGEWPPGTALPREADLSVMLGVSRSVVREAVRILGAKGLLRSRTSDGTRVTPLDEWRLLDPDVMDWWIRAGDTAVLLRDLLKLRLVLEPAVARLATETADAPARAAIMAAWAAKAEVFATPGPDPAARRRRFIETDVGFHRAFLAAVESRLLQQLFAAIEAALTMLFDTQMRDRGYVTTMIGMEESHRLHAEVIDAFERRDPAGAERAMRHLLECSIADAEAALAKLGARP